MSEVYRRQALENWQIGRLADWKITEMRAHYVVSGFSRTVINGGAGRQPCQLTSRAQSERGRAHACDERVGALHRFPIDVK